MSVFDPELHTPEALSDEIARLHAEQPDARIVGSLGRSVLFGQLIGDPIHEFTLRKHADVLQVAGQARDIDILGGNQEQAVNFNPFEVEISGFANPYVKFVHERGDWFVVSERHGFAEPLEPCVMEPVIGQGALGIELITLPVQTLIATYGLKGQLRNKDVRTKQMLQEAVKDAGQTLYPAEYLAPLTEIAERNRKSLYVRAQDTYRRRVPDSIRSRAVPFIGVAKRAFLLK